MVYYLAGKSAGSRKGFSGKCDLLFKNLPSNIETWLLNAVTKVSEWNSKLREKGAEAAKGLLSAVVDGLKNLPSKMLVIGGNIVKRLMAGYSEYDRMVQR